MPNIPSNLQSFTPRQHMLSAQYEVYHYRDSHLGEVALHHHDFYEIYLFLHGDVAYTVENRTYPMAPGDLLLIVTERQTPDGPRYELPSGDLLPMPDVYAYMRLHGQGVLLIDDLPELPNPHAWVTVTGARIRKGSGSSFDSVCRLQVGDELEVLIDSEVWVKVRFEKREGYVLRGYISYKKDAMDTKPNADLLITTEWLLNAPDKDAERICKMPARVSVHILETMQDGWTKLQYQNETGYIPTDRLKKGWGVIQN